MKRIWGCSIAVSLLLPATASFAQQKMEGMQAMDMAKQTASAQSIHKTVAMVKKVDTKAGTVTLDHEPVQSLNWPAMTMGFKVADKKMRLGDEPRKLSTRASEESVARSTQ